MISFYIVHTRSSPPEVILGKCVLEICSKFTREHPCRSVISILRSSAWVLSCKFAAYCWNFFAKNTSGITAASVKQMV